MHLQHTFYGLSDPALLYSTGKMRKEMNRSLKWAIEPKNKYDKEMRVASELAT
jgi:hypothetical protein